MNDNSFKTLRKRKKKRWKRETRIKKVFKIPWHSFEKQGPGISQVKGI